MLLLLSYFIIHIYAALSRGYANIFEFYTQFQPNLCIFKIFMQENIHLAIFDFCFAIKCIRFPRKLKYIIAPFGGKCNHKKLAISSFLMYNLNSKMIILS